MAFCCSRSLIILLSFVIYSYESTIIPPTISNSSGEYYINSLSNQTNFQNDTIICHSTNCYILCDIINGCSNAMIDSTNSINLALQCTDQSSCHAIQLFTATNTTNILCTDSTSCQSSIINSSISSILSLTCRGEKSCQNTHINYNGIGDENDITSTIYILCTASKSCDNAIIYAPYISSLHTDTHASKMNIYAQYADIITIYCHNGECNHWNVQAQYVNIINISCNYADACSYLDINATYAQSVNINALTYDADYNARPSWQSSTIYALNATSVSITCTYFGSYSYISACDRGSYYVPSSGLELNCYGTGCYNMGDFYVWNNITNAQFNIDGCRKCDSLGKCAPSFALYCGLYYNGSDMVYTDTSQFKCNSYNSNSCSCSKYHYCGCPLLLDEAKNNFNNDFDSVCHYYAPIYTCRRHTECIRIIMFSIAGGFVCIFSAIGFCFHYKRIKRVFKVNIGFMFKHKNNVSLLSGSINGYETTTPGIDSSSNVTPGQPITVETPKESTENMKSGSTSQTKNK